MSANDRLSGSLNSVAIEAPVLSSASSIAGGYK